MVVMDRQDYINKANQLLNQNSYKVISKDPTNTIKNKLINILKNIKTKSGLGTNIYKSMYPTGCVPPKFFGLPKIHKPDTPLRPIVSSCGSVTYGVAKELAKILKPLVGKSPHHINSTQDFVEQARQFKLEPGECLSSYDVSALFTSVPIDPALNIIKDLLDKDTTLKERTVMEVGDIILLLLGVDFSYCWLNLVEAWYSLEQYIGLKEDKLSSTTVDFIRSEGNLETKHLYWFSKSKMCWNCKKLVIIKPKK